MHGFILELVRDIHEIRDHHKRYNFELTWNFLKINNGWRCIVSNNDTNVKMLPLLKKLYHDSNCLYVQHPSIKKLRSAMNCSVIDTTFLDAVVDKCHMMNLEIRDLLRVSGLHCECIFCEHFEIYNIYLFVSNTLPCFYDINHVKDAETV